MNTLPSVIYYDRPLPVGMRICQLTVVGWKFHKDFPDLLVHIVHCDCGKVVELSGVAIEDRQNGFCNLNKTVNCTWRSDICQARSGVATHLDSQTKLYRRWVGIKQRCDNPKHRAYHRYGGRGIRVCEEWRNDYHVFKVWSVQHGFRDGLDIDRIDNDGNYEPSNCRYVTRQENLKNRNPYKHRRKYA